MLRVKYDLVSVKVYLIFYLINNYYAHQIYTSQILHDLKLD